jgi:hypothetical protein
VSNQKTASANSMTAQPQLRDPAACDHSMIRWCPAVFNSVSLFSLILFSLFLYPTDRPTGLTGGKTKKKFMLTTKGRTHYTKKNACMIDDVETIPQCLCLQQVDKQTHTKGFQLEK